LVAGNDIEVMSVHEMIELFSTEGLSKRAAIFDYQKTRWMNGQHLAAMTSTELAPLVTRSLSPRAVVRTGAHVADGRWQIRQRELRTLSRSDQSVDEIVRSAVRSRSSSCSDDSPRRRARA